MKKNVIFWVGIKNETHADKYGNFEYFEYSKTTWKHFCKRFNCEFIEFNEPVHSDLFRYRVNWQKAIYVFDILDQKGIDYDQIAIVDSTCMYRWDAPNFFKLTDHKFTAWRDNDNLNWVYQSVKGYESFFKYQLDISKYVNSGFIIFNETHKQFFNSFKQLFEDNQDFFIDAESNTIKKGTEQTPLNYWLQLNNIEVKTDLPIAFKLTHLHRKDLFSYNWQLNDDTRPFFMKYGYNWIFNGFAKNDRSNIMKQVWDSVKQYYDDNYVLNKTRHKHQYRKTISYKFKQDLIFALSSPENKNNTVLELGCCRGDLSLALSSIFKKVVAVDISDENIEYAKKTYGYAANINFVRADVYNGLEYPDNVSVVIIDARREKENIIGLIKFLKQRYDKLTIVQVDYGNSSAPSIKDAIDECANNGTISIVKYIGENIGNFDIDIDDPNHLPGAPIIFNAPEGVIFNLN
jgi:hypothetical protein